MDEEKSSAPAQERGPARPRRRRSPDPGGPSVSVVVPAKDESENLPLLFEKFAVEFQSRRLRGEVILVDDGSVDGTHEIARAGAAQYRWLRTKRHSTNRGLTEALKTGFDSAHNDIMVFWPADLQYMPEDIPKLVNKFSDGFDVVTGWKQGRYGLKRLVSYCYNALSRMLFGVKVHDLNSVKGFRRDVVERIPWRKDWHRYMVVWAADQGFRIGEVKVKLYPRFRGKTKFSIWRIPVGVLDLLAVKFQMSFLRKPLLFFGSWGMVLIAAGLLIGLVALYLRFVLLEGYRPLLYLVLLFETIGVLLFAIGFLAEAIVDLGDRMQSQIDRLREGDGGGAARTKPRGSSRGGRTASAGNRQTAGTGKRQPASAGSRQTES